MNGSHEAPGPPPRQGVADPAEEPSVRAARLFAGLMGEPQPANGAARSSSAPRSEAGAPAAGRGPNPSDPRAPAESEVVDFLVSARDALERTARAVRAVRARAKTTAGDLATLGDAIVEALEATNERLTHIERLVGEAPPDSERTEIAMEELRSAVRRSAERAEGGAGASAAH